MVRVGEGSDCRNRIEIMIRRARSEEYIKSMKEDTYEVEDMCTATTRHSAAALELYNSATASSTLFPLYTGLRPQVLGI